MRAVATGISGNRGWVLLCLSARRDPPCGRTGRGAPAATHLLVLGLEQRNLLFHLTDVAGGLGHLGPLQVPLGQQLFDVLLLLLQRLLQGRGARDLAGVTRRGLRELRRGASGAQGSKATGTQQVASTPRGCHWCLGHAPPPTHPNGDVGDWGSPLEPPTLCLHAQGRGGCQQVSNPQVAIHTKMAWKPCKPGPDRDTCSPCCHPRPQHHPYQATAAGPAAHGGGHGADGADGGAAGAMGQCRDAHGHALGLLGLGRAGGREADADHLVDGRKQAKLGRALEVPGEREVHVAMMARSLRPPQLFTAQWRGHQPGPHRPHPVLVVPSGREGRSS